ncbi:unnamed protein product [Parascedosporium putredinis]|uniref:Xylanolytic transcriptional activator regulatory domain-containing protein n=1 Tax=Parascedosporium putredinis TaxID=1442378 RepID=A0A9P1GX92_9PEZI|nr:unnamed protein product [Parascedosporium putredinis]CAI7989559.1 unnamed protein product [Parascedosporium putredinis]
MQLAEESGLADDASSEDEHGPGVDADGPQDADMGDSGVRGPGPAVPAPAATLGDTVAAVGAPHHGMSPDFPIHSPQSTPGSAYPDVSRLSNSASSSGAFQVTPDGRRSYFGPTSYVHLARSSSTLWNRHAKQQGSSPAPGASRLLVPQEKQELENNLVDCFFTWDNIFLDAFDEGIYRRDKARYEAGQECFLYSPTLGYAILAVGQLYASDSDWMADDLSQNFGSRARGLVTAELDAPSVSTVMALIILCSLSAAEALDDQGWFYSGTALRLITALGLDQQGSLFHPAEDLATLQLLQRSIVVGATCLDTLARLVWKGSRLDVKFSDPSDHASSLLTQLSGGSGDLDGILAALQRLRALPPHLFPQACIESANEISRLQHVFRQTYGLGRLHPLSTHPMLAASLVSVQSFADAPAQSREARQARQNVLRSIQVFGEVAETLNVGARALDIVMAAQRG